MKTKRKMDETLAKKSTLMLAIALATFVFISGCITYHYIQIGSPGSATDVITVAASDHDDTIASFSSRGPTADGVTKPDISAPGVDIIAAKASGTNMGEAVGSHYTSASGTSMSTPQVSGAAALVIQAYKKKYGVKPNPAAVKAALMLGADSIKDTYGLDYDSLHQGAGRINVNNAIAVVLNENSTLFVVNPRAWSASKATGEIDRHTGISEPMLMHGMIPGDSVERTFTFIAGKTYSDLRVEGSGEVGGWLEFKSKTNLSMSENTHSLFEAKLNIPENASGGIHSGSISVYNGSTKIAEVPVSALVLSESKLLNGRLSLSRNITANDTAYVMFNVPAVTYTQLNVTVGWDNDSGSSSDYMAYFVYPNRFVQYLYYASAGYDSNTLDIKAASSGNYTLVLWSNNKSADVSVTLVALNVTPAIPDDVSLAVNQTANRTLLVSNLGVDLINVSVVGYREREISDTAINTYYNTYNVSYVFYVSNKVQSIRMSVTTNSTSYYCLVSARLYNSYNVVESYFTESYCSGTDNVEVLTVNLPAEGYWKLNLTATESVNVVLETALSRYDDYNGVGFSQTKISNLSSNSHLALNYTLSYDPALAGRHIKAYIGLFSNKTKVSVPINVIQSIDLSNTSVIRPFRGGWLDGKVTVPEGNWTLIFSTNSPVPSQLLFVGQSGVDAAYSDGNSIVNVPLYYKLFGLTYMYQYADSNGDGYVDGYWTGKLSPQNTYYIDSDSDFIGKTAMIPAGTSLVCFDLDDDNNLSEHCFTNKTYNNISGIKYYVYGYYSGKYGYAYAYPSGMSSYSSGYVGELDGGGVLQYSSSIYVDIDGDGMFSGINEKSLTTGDFINMSSKYYEVSDTSGNLTLSQISRNNQYELNVSGRRDWNVKVVGKTILDRIAEENLSMSDTGNGKAGYVNLDKDKLVKFFIVLYNPTNNTLNPDIYVGSYYFYPYIPPYDVYRREIPASYLTSRTKIEVVPYYTYDSNTQAYYKLVYSIENTTSNISCTLRNNLTDVACSLIDQNPVVINEFLPNPNSSEQEWIELYNRGWKNINLGGWRISSNNPPSYTMPDGASIGVREFMLFYQNTTSITLDDSADEVRLINSTGGVVDSVSYYNGESFDNNTTYNSSIPLSIGRTVDGEGGWASFSKSTPNASNVPEFRFTLDAGWNLIVVPLSGI